jgi:hypothetical protein
LNQLECTKILPEIQILCRFFFFFYWLVWKKNGNWFWSSPVCWIV